MFEKRPKLGYAVNLIITIICISVFPLFILKDNPFYGFIIGVVLAFIINSLLGANWTPEWKLFKRKK